MKSSVKVSVVQFAPKWLAAEQNAIRMKEVVEQECTDHGAELVVFPELANVGYVTSFSEDFGRRYISASEPIPGPTTQTLGEAARRAGAYVIVGISELHPRIPATLYNSAALITPTGDVMGVHRKVHIAMEEKHYFVPGSSADVYTTELGNIAMEICYDTNFPELVRIQSLKGAEIVCAIFACPTGWGAFTDDPRKLEHRAATRAYENRNYFIACNRSGRDGERSYVGHSVVAGPKGNIVGYLETEDEAVLRVELCDQEIVEARVLCPVYCDRRPEMYGAITQPL